MASPFFSFRISVFMDLRRKPAFGVMRVGISTIHSICSKSSLFVWLWKINAKPNFRNAHSPRSSGVRIKIHPNPSFSYLCFIKTLSMSLGNSSSSLDIRFRHLMSMATWPILPLNCMGKEAWLSFNYFPKLFINGIPQLVSLTQSGIHQLFTWQRLLAALLLSSKEISRLQRFTSFLLF